MRKRNILLGAVAIAGIGCCIFSFICLGNTKSSAFELAQKHLKKNGSLIWIAGDYGERDSLEEFGFEETARFAGLSLMKNSGKYDNLYRVTQYASVTGNQAMIYSIEDCQGHFVLVDGGWYEDEENVKTLIEDLGGGEVDAWILTHPHQDHIGAFNALMRDCPDEVEIGTIYVSDFDYDQYHDEAMDWDGFWVYEDFLSVTEGMTNLTELHAGDELDLIGLNMKVLSSYSNKVPGTDASNDGSLMFKLTGEETSMLFCGDVGKRMSKVLIKQWGEELKSDYIQMGHHGNGGLSKKFYKKTAPSVAFFDAPQWLMNAEGSSYTTPKNRKIMENMGAEIVSYVTAPNSVIIK